MHFKFYLKWCHTHYALDSMLCHCHTSQVCGGWVGVPTFEVISLLFPALPYPWDMMQCVACGQMCFATRYVLRVYVRHLQSMCGCNVASWMFIPQSAMNQKKKERQFHVKIQMSVACVVVSVVFMWRMFALGRQGAGTSSLIYVMRCLYV